MLQTTSLEDLLSARLVRMRLHARRFVHRRRLSTGTFEYLGRSLPYFWGAYNRTWLNERQVEIAVARDFLDRRPSGAIGLEVGNVLSHYGAVDHAVVDKYEVAPGVENEDVVDLPSGPRFDYIVTISTLEHVGWDEAQKDVEKATRALHHLRSLLTPGGTMLVSVPLGHHPHLDAELLSMRALDAQAETYVLDRNWRWRRRNPTVEDFRYHCALRTAHALWIGEFGPVDSPRAALIDR